MEKSIKKRLTGSFMIVILLTVLILEIVVLNVVRQYYYNSVEELLSNQIEFSSKFYSRYFSSSNLEDIIIDDVDVFWNQTDAQVQIINLDKEVLIDSIGVLYNPNVINSPDVEKALKGERGVWSGEVSYTDHSVMSVAYPLKVDGDIVGILRFVTSLEDTNAIIYSISKVFVLLGIGVVLISGIFSVFLSNSIIRPLKEVTEVAAKMADGQLKVRSIKKVDDEIGKLSDTLNYMAEELLRKEQIKNDFVSSISHELRTPLTSIKGWAITLKEEDIGEDSMIKDGLEIIEQESDRLTNMVEDLLDFSKFASGRIVLNKDNMDFYDVASQVYKQLIPKAKELNIEFTSNLDENAGFIIGDENRLKQVLINILDNAIKFTPEGGKVHYSVQGYNNMVVVQVEDTGPGISQEDLPYIKDRFYKGKNSKSHSGLGLSICDEIVNLHGGDMDIQSLLGHGTKVLVSLPINGGDKK